MDQDALRGKFIRAFDDYHTLMMQNRELVSCLIQMPLPQLFQPRHLFSSEWVMLVR